VDLPGDEKLRVESLRETEVLRSLSHPNIIGYYEAFLDGTTLCIAMEYADGGDLSAAVHRRREACQMFTERDAIMVLAQLVFAVQYLHDRRILHRDLKSQNVFLNVSGTVKLGDFGIAKVLEASCQWAETRVGTPYYLPPEICENQPYDFKADVWCLGVIFYEVLALEVPFSANNIAALALRICTMEPRPVPALYGGETRALLTRMLTKRACDRPSIDELATVPHICRCAPASLALATGMTPARSLYGGYSEAGGAAPSSPSGPRRRIMGSTPGSAVDSSVTVRTTLEAPPVDLAEAEHMLLGESPQKRPRAGLGGRAHSPSPCTSATTAATPRDSASLILAELELLLRQPVEDSMLSPPVSPSAKCLETYEEEERDLFRQLDGDGLLSPRQWDGGGGGLPISSRAASKEATCRSPRTPVTCSKMLRNLERDFGLF
jgi:NIMA (never in mitosis gene a)-related kinase